MNNQMVRGVAIINLIINKNLVTTRTQDIRNYIIVILMLLFETSPFFDEAKLYFWFLNFLLLIICTAKNEQLLNKKIWQLLVVIWSLILIQTFLYDSSYTPAMIYRPFYNFYTPFLIFLIMGIKYFKYLFNVIYIIAIYTSIIYLLHTFEPSFYTWLMQSFDEVYKYSWATWPRTILIYNVPRESGYYFMRNSAIFHEAGAYAIYLMLSIIINSFFTKNLLNFKTVFLSIVLLSTFSTTGYVMLVIFLIYVMYNIKLNIYFKHIIILPLLLFGLFFYFQESEFLGPKLEDHYITQIEQVKAGEKDIRGRFYSFGMSMRSFVESPIIGRGILSRDRYDVGTIGSFGYGFPGLFAMYGLFFSLFYLYYFYKGFILMSTIYNRPKLYGVMAFVIINLGLLTQIFFFHTPFILFFLIGLFGQHYYHKF